MAKARGRPAYTRTIVLSFLLLIMLGGFLLMLPLSSREGEWTPPLCAFFTAVSATCVTGLVVVDTFIHWSVFGQAVILLLIQVGGLGFMTLLTAFTAGVRRRISVRERTLLMQSTGAMSAAELLQLTKRIFSRVPCFSRRRGLFCSRFALFRRWALAWGYGTRFFTVFRRFATRALT